LFDHPLCLQARFSGFFLGGIDNGLRFAFGRFTLFCCFSS
jgi:hypothetical protein